MKIEFQVIPMSDILNHWLKDYKEPIANYEAFIDPHKQYVVFKLFVDESKLTSAAAAPRER